MDGERAISRIHPKKPEDLKKLWREAHFSFDANVLLNAYELTAQSQKSFFEQLKRLGKRSFLTRQAAAEFYRNRSQVIGNAKRTFEGACSLFEEIPAAFSEPTRKKLEAVFEEEKKLLEKHLHEDPV